MKIFLNFIFLFVFTVLLNAQSIYEPVYKDDIYNFIERLSNRGLTEFLNDIRPVSRLTITEKLLAIFHNKQNLSDADKERLIFYLQEYSLEVRYLKNDSSTTSEFFRDRAGERFNFYKFYSPIFTLIADPVLGVGYDFTNKTYHQFTGVQLYGRISDNWGYYFNYRDNLERGNNIDRAKSFSPVTGVVVSKSNANKIEYSETRGGISYGWKWGRLTAAKDFIHIGSSSQSSIILSEKAPSFPFIRLEVSPVDWFRYDFIHGWLKSGLIDSSTIMYTGVTSTYENRSLSYSSLNKYYVGHSVSVKPFNNWWLSLGESLIYGRNLEFIYFLPIFLRLADHYNSMHGGSTGDNAQLYLNTSYIWQAIQSKIYFTFYIDEMSPESLFSAGNNAQVYAITIGGNFTNPLWKDNYFTLEYNAVRPYSYMNGDPLNTYMTAGYQLGTWIGSNAVQIYASMEQYLPYMINVGVYYNYVMKGEKENINSYYDRVTSTYPLLAGANSYYSDLGFNLSYQPLNDLFFNLNFDYVNIASGRFVLEYSVKKGTTFGVGVRYGF